MNILAIIERYSDAPAATAICAKKVLESLVQRGHCIYVVSPSTYYSDPFYENGVSVTTVTNMTYRAVGVRTKENRSRYNTITFICFSLLWYIIRLREKLSSWKYSDSMCCRRFVKVINDIIKKYNVDLVISFSAPFSCQVLASKCIKMHNEKPKWIAYEMDPYAYNYFEDSRAIRERSKFEEQILDEVDYAIFSDGIAEENDKQNHLTKLSNKRISLPLPGLIVEPNRNEVREESKQKDKYIFVYTGIFYTQFRRPTPLLRYLDQSSLNYELHIYGIVYDDIYKTFEQYPRVIQNTKFLGQKDSAICRIACEEASILVNIENDVSNQVPSKLFTYMSTGVPILNFYNPEYTLGKNYLDNYKCSLNILKEDANDTNIVKTIDNFVRNSSAIDAIELKSILEPFSHEVVVDKIDCVIRRVCQ